MSLRIYISEFPEYDEFPSKGSHSYTDSRVFELEFDIDSIEYFVKFHISIKYNRWFYPETYEEPVEDDFEIEFDTIEEGKMTKDLALITTLENPTVLNSEGFIKAIAEKLK